MSLKFLNINIVHIKYTNDEKKKKDANKRTSSR